ncbi:MAG: translation initiation factor IF-3 [Thermoguttaceae bacterium]|nr:translation initiation factor IF-3 [Thermoguttaceae bacterium]MDO4856382.1 translation initiation factor IF-3 [Thermoguttaceae bacterium]
MSLKKGPADSKNQQRVNEQIRAREVRVISEAGEQLGIMHVRKALELAQEAGLDLVEVAQNDKCSVCKIMDYGKFKYQMTKKQNKANPHVVKVKEIRLRPGTGDNDVIVKVNAAKGFLEKKDKVLVSVIFRGREMIHIQEGERMIKQVIEMLAPYGKVDSKPTKQGKRISCTIAPN